MARISPFFPLAHACQRPWGRRSGKNNVSEIRRRSQVLVLSPTSTCVVAMEAWGSPLLGAQISEFGHTLRLIPLPYVKPFVKRQKNCAADAEPICKAAPATDLVFCCGESEPTQARSAIFRTRDLLVPPDAAYQCCSQATRRVLPHRGPKGAANLNKLVATITDPGRQFS